MPDAGSGRTLLVLRHAKAANPPGTRDVDRPLTTDGRSTAAAVGTSLPTRPDLVLCSTAVRTRQTWDEVRSAGGLEVETRFEPSVYDASLRDLLDLVAALPDDATTVLLVGHNPGCQELVLHLTGEPVRMRPGMLVAVGTRAPWVAVVAGGGAELLR